MDKTQTAHSPIRAAASKSPQKCSSNLVSEEEEGVVTIQLDLELKFSPRQQIPLDVQEWAKTLHMPVINYEEMWTSFFKTPFALYCSKSTVQDCEEFTKDTDYIMLDGDKGVRTAAVTVSAY